MDRDFLEGFLKTYRPSGFEKMGADFFADEVKKNIPNAKVEFIDNMWNVCASVGSEQEDALKILISGHSDQNCLIVTEITKNGFLKYTPQGGISPKSIIDTDMYVLTNEFENYRLIPCFCSYKAIHLEETDERKKCPEHKDLVLDLGCTSREEVEELGVKIGDLVVFKNTELCMGFGYRHEYIVGSGLDDGVACGIVYDMLKYFGLEIETLKKNNIRLYCACISSEETGARGVGPVVRKIQPNISIDIDVCHDSTKEVGTDKTSDVHMGKGVVIKFGPDKNRQLTSVLRRDAIWKEIPFQVMAGKAGGTNTNNIQMMSDDCATALLSIPCRYMHSTSHEMVSRQDIECCEKLLIEFLTSGWK